MSHTVTAQTAPSARSFYAKLRQRSLQDHINSIRHAYFRLKGRIFYKFMFASFGENSVLFPPLLLSHPQHIFVGSNVLIRDYARIEAIPLHGRTPELRIGDNVNIEQNVHIICHSRVIIGNDVSITGQCAIVDVTHPFESGDPAIKIGSRILNEDSFVEIGDGSFLGYGSVILPNVRIGKACVIGAHAVITKDVPDFSVVAGNPARVVRQYR